MYKLAPQLTGKAQQAYASMGAEEAGDYKQVKEAILRRYISQETYCQRLCAVSVVEDPPLAKKPRIDQDVSVCSCMLFYV